MTITETTRGGLLALDTQPDYAAPGSDHRLDHYSTGAHVPRVEPVTTSDSGQPECGTHTGTAAVGTNFPADQGRFDAQPESVVGEQGRNGSATTIVGATTRPPVSLADPFLALSADIVDDAERNRIANENRLRQLTRAETDSDGEERGFGLDESHPDVARLAALVDMLRQVEHQAVLQLNRKVRVHPLGPWVKAQRGIGEKQAARLLAVIGDPYWNDLHNRPRTVSELWAYCGYHTLASGDHSRDDSHALFVAARRVKGQKANWSTLAKTRAYLIAESCMKAGGPYREVYDARKEATEGRLHAADCVRCGPSGKPARAGSEWSAGHRHADALRITAKTILRDLWREAKRIHETGEAK